MAGITMPGALPVDPSAAGEPAPFAGPAGPPGTPVEQAAVRAQRSADARDAADHQALAAESMLQRWRERRRARYVTAVRRRLLRFDPRP